MFSSLMRIEVIEYDGVYAVRGNMENIESQGKIKKNCAGQGKL